MFFDQGGGSGSMFGGQPNASAFTTPGGGMNPQAMAMLQAMQNRGAGGGMPGGGAPMLPQAAPPSQMNATQGPIPQAPQGGQNILQMLMSNPEMRQKLMALFGGGGGMGGGAPGAGMGGMPAGQGMGGAPGGGTGGLY